MSHKKDARLKWVRAYTQMSQIYANADKFREARPEPLSLSIPRTPIQLPHRIKSIPCSEEEGPISYERDGPFSAKSLFFLTNVKI